MIGVDPPIIRIGRAFRGDCHYASHCRFLELCLLLGPSDLYGTSSIAPTMFVYHLDGECLTGKDLYNELKRQAIESGQEVDEEPC